MDYRDGFTDMPNAEPRPKEFKLQVEELDTEFKRKFPPDPLGKEMEDGARVWKVYREEATAHDATALDGWNKTLDILLIFAGLFSAVATAFVIESYQQLDTPSHDAYVATALYLLVAASNVSAGITLPPPPGLQASAPELARWINGLWFTSLLLSLSVALLSILVKQWIGEYTARNNASAQSPRHWARRHQLFFGALNAWPVAELVSILPLLLHLSLFLFFAGVVAFLWTLDRAIGAWIVVLGLSLVVFYLACTLIPLWRPECPTSTPLVKQIRKGLVACRVATIQTVILALSCSAHLSSAVLWYILRRRSPTEVTRKISADDAPPISISIFRHRESLRVVRERLIPARKSKLARLQDALASLETERTVDNFMSRHLLSHADDLDTDVLQWLITSVSDRDAVAVGVQALGALHPDSSLAHQIRIRNFLSEFDWQNSIASVGSNDVEVVRIMRSIVCIRATPEAVFDMYLPDRVVFRKDADHPDMAILSRFFFCYGLGPSLPLTTFQGLPCPSLTSTCVLLMRLRGVGINGILALLLLCDFDQFTAADWDLVASLLRRYSNMYLSRTAARTLQNELWLADWFARLLICHQGDAVFVSSAGMLITRLMAKSKGYLPGSIVDLPFLYDYLGSSLFCEIRHTHDELRSISKLAVVAVHLSGMAPSINPARRFAHITSNVLIASKSLSRVGDSESGLGICYEITLLFLWLLHYKAGDHPDKSQLKGLVQHLSDLLNCLLKPVSSSPSDARSPIFEVIIRRAVTSGSSSYNVTVQMSTAWRLTCRIAAGLSFIARHRQCGNIDEVEPLIDSFFASVRCSSLLRLWISCTQFDSSLASPDWDESNVLFIQHRMDMRPSWWRTGLEELLENAHSDTATASAREYALWLNDEAARRGPCRICPGVPLGWDTAEHDDAHDI